MIPSVNNLVPGQYGVSPGGGLVGELIRHATASRAGHAFIYIGEGKIIESAPPAVRISDVHNYPAAWWAWKMPIRPDQSEKAVARAHALLGEPYDYPAYIGFALEILHVQNGTELDDMFKRDTWRVCSALVADCLMFAGVALNWERLTPQERLDQRVTAPNLISPSMLDYLAISSGWYS